VPGPHGFAVRFNTGRLRAAIAHKLEARPATTSTRPTLLRPSHPFPTFVTMANAPLAEQDGGINKAASTKRRSEIFLQTGLDGGIAKQPVGQIS
jgi:hypothetical protein